MSETNVEDTDINPNKRKWRKKRKNFISNAKKYAKKGQMGRGTKMPEELYQYFVGILETMKKGIEDNEERYILVNNVLERTKGEELNIIGNQLGCRIIELLLPYSTPEDLERFIEIISPELRKLCSDNFSSHVVETLLRVSCERATEHLQNGENKTADSDEEIPNKKLKKEEMKESKYKDKHVKSCYQFTLKVCKYALNNLEEFVWDSYANHILRSALKCLSGITLLPGEKPKTNMFKETIPDNKGIPPHQTKITYKTTPKEFKELVLEFSSRLSSWPQFKDLPYQNITSGLLQVLLYAVKNVDKNVTKDLLKKLLNESFAPEDWTSPDTAEEKKDEKIIMDCDEDVKDEVCAVTQYGTSNLPPVFEKESAVRLLEAALFVAKKKMYTQIYAKCFINRLAQLSMMPMLNFTVQRLFDHCIVKEEFEPMFEELSDKYGTILSSGNTGVLVAVGKACLRIKAKQTQFITNLETALKCTEAENQKYFPVCCLRLLPLDRIDVSTLAKEYFINVHGSVIMQSILDFQRPTKVVNALLELPSDQLVVIFCDAKGSHVADAFFKGQFVGVKSRDKMIWKLKGYYQQMALSQYGSRAFERIFDACTIEQKVKIMTELSEKSGLLLSTAYGRVVSAKINVELFKLSQDKWKAALDKEVKARNIFSDIVGKNG